MPPALPSPQAMDRASGERDMKSLNCVVYLGGAGHAHLHHLSSPRPRLATASRSPATPATTVLMLAVLPSMSKCETILQVCRLANGFIGSGAGGNPQRSG